MTAPSNESATPHSRKWVLWVYGAIVALLCFFNFFPTSLDRPLLHAGTADIYHFGFPLFAARMVNYIPEPEYMDPIFKPGMNWEVDAENLQIDLILLASFIFYGALGCRWCTRGIKPALKMHLSTLIALSVVLSIILGVNIIIKLEGVYDGEHYSAYGWPGRCVLINYDAPLEILYFRLLINIFTVLSIIGAVWLLLEYRITRRSIQNPKPKIQNQ